MKPDRIAMIRAAAQKGIAKRDTPDRPVYLRTGNTPHKAVPSWNYRMMRR